MDQRSNTELWGFFEIYFPSALSYDLYIVWIGFFGSVAGYVWAQKTMQLSPEKRTESACKALPRDGRTGWSINRAESTMKEEAAEKVKRP